MHDNTATIPQASTEGGGPVPEVVRAGAVGTGAGQDSRSGQGSQDGQGARDSGGTPAPVPRRPSLVGRLLGLLTREPVLFVSLAYILVSFMGIWSSYWFYRTLGLPILDYLQGSDLFIAGLRRPDYVLLVALSLAVPWVSAAPMRLAERDPARAERLRRSRWWGPLVFPEQRGWMGLWGMRSETMLAFGALILLLCYLYLWNTKMAERVADGVPSGQQVRLTLAGSDAALPGRASLLGTTSMFVLVWWPDTSRVEALPTANIARIESVASPRMAQRPPPPAQPAASVLEPVLEPVPELVSELVPELVSELVSEPAATGGSPATASTAPAPEHKP